MLRILILLASIFSLTVKVNAQCITNIDFNTWMQTGDPANGNWALQNGGTTVYQSVNSQPTYYISPYDLINVDITGTFRSDDSDNDFMGFVIGFNAPLVNNTDHDYILFDWKQGYQVVNGNISYEGMTLTRVDGNIPVSGSMYEQYFFGHIGPTPPIEILATNYGTGTGWTTSIDHQFRCIYTQNRITIYIDGNLVFDVADCFKPGRFGFYNYSQPQVTYSNFNYTLGTSFDIGINNICQDDSASFVFIDVCSANFNYSVIDEMHWDFGDGNSFTNTSPNAQNINPKHLYASGGTYTVTLTTTDQNGCQDVTTETITVYDLPNAQISVPDACFNSNSEFENLTTAGDGNITQWIWNRGDNTTSNAFDFNYLYADSGVYNIELIVIDDNTCTDTTSIQHTVHPLPQVSSQEYNLSCFESGDGEIHPMMAGGNTPYTYAWSDNSSDSIADNLIAGTYTITVSDVNSCTGTATNTVSQPNPLEIVVSTSDYNGYEISCYNFSDGEISIASSGGTTPYQYDWNSGQFSSNPINNLSEGNYNLVLTDANNCQLDSIITLSQPDSLYATTNISQYNGGWEVSCAQSTDGSIDISTFNGVSPYQYNWNNGQFNSQDINFLPVGTYTLELEDLNGCLFVDSFTLEAPDSIENTLTTSEYVGGWGVSCFEANDGSITSNSTGGTQPYNYTWSNNAGNNSSIANLEAGTYTLTITDDNGCEFIDEATITEPDELTASSSIENITCYDYMDGSFEVYVSGGTEIYSYAWSDSSINSSYRVDLEPGTYTVTITDTNNCQTSIYNTISQPDSMGVWVPDSMEIIYGGIAEIEALYKENGRANYFNWTPEQDLNCYDCPEIEASPLENIYYTVEFFDDYGCSVKDSIFIKADEKIFYAPNAFSPNNDNNNDFFTIYSSGVRLFKMRIFNRWGEMIFLTEDIETGWNGVNTNGSIASEGVYIYTAQLIYFDGQVDKIEGSVSLFR